MLLSVIPPLQPMRVTRCLDLGSGQDPSNPKITNITDQEYYSNNIFMKHAYTDLKQVPRDRGKAHHHVLEFVQKQHGRERERGQDGHRRIAHLAAKVVEGSRRR